MISVVIPLYNKAQSIRSTIDSVLRQTWQQFEIVVVDDGSTDSGAEEVNKISDPRLRLVRQPNAGVSAARNRGIEESRGEYIAFLDADDLWDADYLQTIANMVAKYPDCHMIGSNYRFCDAEGKLSPTVLRKMRIEGDDGVFDNYFEVAACSNPPLWTSAVVVRKDALEAVGGFPVGVKSGEDLLTWARLACRGKIAYSMTPRATFNADGYKNTERPKRLPAEDDYVGAQLKTLYTVHRDVRDLRSYLSMWHKMRSSIYMRLGMRRRSIREAMIAIRYNPLNYKLYAYIAINLIGLRTIR